MKWLRKLSYYFSYMGAPPWDTGISPPELMEFIQTHSPGRALDLGCGTGTNAITLAKNNWKVTGVDFIAKAIRSARKKAKNANIQVRFVVDDVTRLVKIDDEFDLLLDIGCFHSLADEGKKGYITNLPRLLAPRAHYLVYAWLADPENPVDTGMTLDDVDSITRYCKLIKREEGTERGQRPSAWLTFQRI